MKKALTLEELEKMAKHMKPKTSLCVGIVARPSTYSVLRKQTQPENPLCPPLGEIPVYVKQDQLEPFRVYYDHEELRCYLNDEKTSCWLWHNWEATELDAGGYTISSVCRDCGERRDTENHAG